jgi:ribulose kinase
MKKLLLALSIFSAITVTAQDLSNCKNPCTKKRIVESGPFIGVRIVNDCIEKNGVTILEVIANTAAQRNNFLVQDHITMFDNVVITDTKQLIDLVGKHQPGDKVAITTTHEGTPITKTIALGAQFTKEVTEQGCCDALNTRVNLQFGLSPNPATSNIRITSDLAVVGDISVTVFDMKGAVVSTFVQKNNGIVNFPVNVSNLNNGEYLVKINCNNGQFIEKLIIAK